MSTVHDEVVRIADAEIHVADALFRFGEPHLELVGGHAPVRRIATVLFDERESEIAFDQTAWIEKREPVTTFSLRGHTLLGHWGREDQTLQAQPRKPRQREISVAARLASSPVACNVPGGRRKAGPDTLTAPTTAPSAERIGAPTAFNPVSSSSTV